MSPEWWNLPCPLVGFVFVTFVQSEKQRKAWVEMANLSVWSLNTTDFVYDWGKNQNVSLPQPRRRLSEHNHGGGLPDDCHTLQMGWVSVCRQGRPLVCRPKLRLPAAAAGVSDHATVSGNHPCTHSHKACDMFTTVWTLLWFLEFSCGLLLFCTGTVHYSGLNKCGDKHCPWY